MTTRHDERFERWLADLEQRHLADLTFPEVSRALRALSSAYVERRHKLGEGAALQGAGKRAAFALFYGPLHFLLLHHIAGALSGNKSGAPIVDLGCGTGVAGTALAIAAGGSVIGIDRHPWAVDEARRMYRAFDVQGQARVSDVAKVSLPERSRVVAAFTVNEIGEAQRQALGERLLAHAARGGQVLIVEPLAGSAAPWWPAWRREWEQAGGRADEWRVAVPLPPMVAKLDRAAGLNHRQLKARSLALGF